MKKHEFVYRKKANGKMSSHFSLLRNIKEGAAIDTHRKVQIEEPHLPIDLQKELNESVSTCTLLNVFMFLL